MKKPDLKTILTRAWRPLVGIGGLVGIVVFSAGGCGPRVTGEPVAGPPGLAVPAGAATVTATAESAPNRVWVMGSVASEEKIHLSARLPATIREVRVASGAAVRKGEILVTLDDRELREQLAAAEAQLKQVETEYQRARQLFESQATTAQALTAAESQFNAARAQVERVRVMLSYTEIKAPIDGIVTERRIEAGDMANPGMPLLSVYDSRRMRLEAPVPVRLIETVALGQMVDIVLERPAAVFTGRVSEIVAEIDPASRTQKVKVRIEDDSGRLLPGTFGRLWLAAGEHRAIRVPAGAVYRVGQLELVQVVANGRAWRRLVKTAPAGDGRVELLSGVNEGEVLLAHPLKEG